MDLKKSEESHEEIDYGLALQNYLDSITLSSPQPIKQSPVLELEAENSVKEAIGSLYEKNVSGALIVDTSNWKFLDRYIGYIVFSDLVFWRREEYDKEKESEEIKYSIDVFTILEECPNIGQTKLADLAKSMLWKPFLPVYLDDTLFHTMLLMSKHRLEVVPVIDRSTSRAIGFVTQIAVTQSLLQSSGLEWFDQIADMALSNFRIENEERVVCAYQDQGIDEAFRMLHRSKLGVIALVDRESKKPIGSLKNSDLLRVLKNETLLHNSKAAVEEFLELDGHKRSNDTRVSGVKPPLTNKKTDTLKQVMENLAETESDFSFLVDEAERALGVIGFRDVIVQFAPPCIDSNIHGDGFFDSALEQTGCHVEKGTLVCKQ